MRRATINQINTCAAEPAAINNPLLDETSTDSGADRPAGQTKRRPLEKYIPVYHVELVRERHIDVEQRPMIRNSDDVVAILRDEFRVAARESLVCVLLDCKNVVIGINVISVGSLTSSIVHPREVLKPAILCNSAAIVLSHPHLSGDPSPSREDIQVTDRINKACEIIGIKLLDHVIGNPRTYSFRNAGRLL